MDRADAPVHKDIERRTFGGSISPSSARRKSDHLVCRPSPTGRFSAARPKCCLPSMNRTFCPAHVAVGQSSALIMPWRPSMRSSPAARLAEVRSNCRYLNSYAFCPSAIDVNGLKLAALYTLQDGLPETPSRFMALNIFT
jgi:hypothetical protein